MIECIFTIDYEIYGNGEGSLRELVYEPAEKLAEIFRKHNARFVVFVEAAELEMIEFRQTDSGIDPVKQQVRDLYEQGFELGLHLHPQWYNAQYTNGAWSLDYSEYNMCVLSEKRMQHMVGRSLAFLRETVGDHDLKPISFRAGNWLFQPAGIAATVLAKHGVKIDSSVYKGGLQHKHGLDYRRAVKNGYYWNFADDVNTAAPDGVLLEMPIHTRMVPFWKMLTGKRVGIQRKSSSSYRTTGGRMVRLRDYLRLRYPLKFDFCRMTFEELTAMMGRVVAEDRKDPSTYRPLVAIGHTKDLVDFETVEAFLKYLEHKDISISTFNKALEKCAVQQNNNV